MILDIPTLHDRALSVGAQEVMDESARAMAVPGGTVSLGRLMRSLGLCENEVRRAVWALANLGHIDLGFNTNREFPFATLRITSSGWDFATVPRPVWMEVAA